MSTSFLSASCFHVREMHVARDDDRCLAVLLAMQRCVQSLHSLVAIRLDGFNRLMMD